jgi:hypothetical protein
LIKLLSGFNRPVGAGSRIDLRSDQR